MSKFLNTPTLEKLESTDDAGRPLYRLLNDLKYQLGPDENPTIIEVKAGAVTNLATVPTTPLLSFLYREIVRLDGKYIAAPILHDVLCNETMPGFTVEDSGYTRFEADALMRSALMALGAPFFQALSVYYAIRLRAICKRVGGWIKVLFKMVFRRK